MRPKTLLVVVALAVAFTLTAPKTFAQNLVTNGSFETGDFTGWTTGGNFEDTFVETGAFYDYTGAQDGNFYAALGPVSTDGTLSETFSDTAGAHYTFSFRFASVGDSPSDFSASWDGTALLSLPIQIPAALGASTPIRSLVPAPTRFSLLSATILAIWPWTTFRSARAAGVELRLSPAALF